MFHIFFSTLSRDFGTKFTASKSLLKISAQDEPVLCVTVPISRSSDKHCVMFDFVILRFFSSAVSHSRIYLFSTKPCLYASYC